MIAWFEHDEKMVKWLTQDEAAYWKAGLYELLRIEQRQLESHSEPIEIGRSQGAVKILKRMLGLKEEIENVMGQATGQPRASA